MYYSLMKTSKLLERWVIICHYGNRGVVVKMEAMQVLHLSVQTYIYIIVQDSGHATQNKNGRERSRVHEQQPGVDCAAG